MSSSRISATGSRWILHWRQQQQQQQQQWMMIQQQQQRHYHHHASSSSTQRRRSVSFMSRQHCSFFFSTKSAAAAQQNQATTTTTTTTTTSSALTTIQRQRQQQQVTNALVALRTTDHNKDATSSSIVVPPKSQRQLFQEIKVHPGILAYIRSTGLGIVPRQRNFQRLDRITQGHRLRGRRQARMTQLVTTRGRRRRTPPPQHDAAAGTTPRPPLPFGNDAFPVRVVAQISTPHETVPARWDSQPHNVLPHVAVCGRSNVGKSTLLNALLYGHRASSSSSRGSTVTGGRRYRDRNFRLPKGCKAGTSNRPGQTRQITFYQLGAPANANWNNAKAALPRDGGDAATTTTWKKTNHRPNEPPRQDVRLVLVDLPGYGFAYASEEEAENFRQMMTQYLTGTGTLAHLTVPKRILLLIDSRHGLKKTDIDFLESIQMALLRESAAAAEDKDEPKSPRTKPPRTELPPIQIVLTKCDLCHQIDLARRVVQVRQQLSDVLIREPSSLPVMLTSTRSTQVLGVLELQKELASLAVKVRPVKPTKKTKMKLKKLNRRSR